MSKPRLSSARLPTDLSVAATAPTPPAPRKRVIVRVPALPREWLRSGEVALGVAAVGRWTWSRAHVREGYAALALSASGALSLMFLRKGAAGVGITGSGERQVLRMGVEGRRIWAAYRVGDSDLGVGGTGDMHYIAADGDEELWLLGLIPEDLVMG